MYVNLVGMRGNKMQKTVDICQTCGNILTTLFTTVLCEYCDGTKNQAWNFQWINNKFYMDASRISDISMHTVKEKQFATFGKYTVPPFISCTRCSGDTKGKFPDKHANANGEIFYWRFTIGGVAYKWLCHSCAEATKLSQLFKWGKGQYRNP